MKQCSKCKIEKPYSEFHKNRTMKDGFVYECKKCSSKRSKQYNQDNIEHRKWIKIKHRYGINKEDWLKMYEVQNGLCAVCSVDLSTVTINTDHNHDTEEVRGLLCGRCNTNLVGSMEIVGKETVLKAFSYLGW